MNFVNFEKIPEKVSRKKEAIEKIKEMDLMLPHQRDLVLVMIGEKPLTLFSFATDLEKKEMGEQFFEKLKDVVEKANLSIEKVEEVDEERGAVKNYFYVAQNKEIISEALEAEKKKRL